jgi:hypothetical protein
MRRVLVLALALLGAVGACALHAIPGVADGDPASDVLLGQNVYFPFNPAVSAALQKQLVTQTAETKKGGLGLKVALIATPVDLGVVPDLFGHPQQYASFLDQEISFSGHPQPLLVVMPAGYGTAGLSPAGNAAVAGLAKPAGKTSDDLATAASTAITKIAKAQHVKLASASGGGGGGGASRIIIILLGVAALLVAAALAVVTLGRRRELPDA